MAIVGSVFASVYSAQLGSAPALAALPVEVRSAMRSSMAVAHRVIEQLPAEHAGQVRDAVNHAFLDGLQVGSLVCAGIALAAAIVVAGLLPAQAQPSNASQPTITDKERQLNP